MVAFLWFFAGAVCAAAVVAWLARRRLARLRAAMLDEARERKQAQREQMEVQERRSRAVATIQTVVADLKVRVEHARLEAARAEERARAANAIATAEAAAAAAARAAAANAHDLGTAATRADEPVAADAACPVQPDATGLAQTLSHEVANIVSAIEGGTFRLIEAVPMLRSRTDAVEGLWLAIRRLRRFHDKLRAYVESVQPERGTTAVEPLLTSLRDELDATELGLQMAWNLPRTVPTLRGSADDLLAALVFVSMALQQLERGALRLSIHVEPCFDSSEPETQLELDLERDETLGEAPPPSAPSGAFLVARAAAQNLLRSLGGSMTISHEPGHSARALVRLPSASPDAVPANAGEPPPPTDIPAVLGRHRYGGALLIESDPTIRSMLASELRATGRAVFACADGAAARSLIQATPERFEMLIVDHAGRLDAGDLLAATAERLCPSLRVLVLSDFADQQLPAVLAARAVRIRKPFGVHELRRALAAALTD